ncbi:MAG: isocitrate lyase/phosphoenolpyruvate mutase family protein [Myxococcota bacterium]
MICEEPTTSASDLFRQLHQAPGLFRLPNCWDAGSARVLESRGARAVATTSAGLAWSWGHPDGDALPTELLLQSVRAIVRAIGIPLSVDIESGYSDAPSSVARLVEQLLAEGVVGVNIEDGAGAPEVLAEKITAIRGVAERTGTAVFVNARTDVYLRGLVDEPLRVQEALRRAALYRAAGADGLFVPKVVADDEIRALAAAGLPLNVLAMPSLSPLSNLEALGVRRVSTGSTLAQVALGRAAAAATAFLDQGMCEPLFEAAMPYGEVNDRFKDR